ncbi:MAG: alkaline phosphatase family protein [Candidatus Aenigmatarchaeota archaeon]|nr:alkaline phosphatase family protein [Nanoarchaeota archaeon]
MKSRILKGTRLEEGITPNYSGLGLANIVPSVCKILGAPLPNQNILSDDIVDYDEMKDIKEVVFLLADGIGYNNLLWEMKQHKLNFSRHKDEIIPLTSIYPSTTTTALATLATGATPQEHGIMGYKLFLKEFGLISNMISFAPILGYVDFMALGIDPYKFLGIDTVYKHMKSNGIEPNVMLPKTYKNSALTNMLYRNANIIGYSSYSRMFSRVRKALGKKKTHKKRFTYIYWDLYDTQAHINGIKTEKSSEVVKTLDTNLFEDLMDKINKPDTLFIMSADHGFVNIDDTYFFHEHEELMDMLIIPPSGEQRFSYLFVKNGKLDEVKAYVKSNLNKQAFAIESEKAIKMGLMGLNDPRKETINRMGDLILIPKKNDAFNYAYTIEDILIRMKANHGGISEDEMLVPFFMKRMGNV